MSQALPTVDITETITCVHQAVTGADVTHSEHRKDSSHNLRYISRTLLKQGFVDCIVFYTRYVDQNTTEGILPSDNQDDNLPSNNNIESFQSNHKDTDSVGDNREPSLSDNRGYSNDTKQETSLGIKKDSSSDNQEFSMSNLTDSLSTKKLKSKSSSENNNFSLGRKVGIALRLPDVFCVTNDPNLLRWHKRSLQLRNTRPRWKHSSKKTQVRDETGKIVTTAALCLFVCILLSALISLCIFPDWAFSEK